MKECGETRRLPGAPRLLWKKPVQLSKKVKRVWSEEKDANEVEHLVYLTEKRAEIAVGTARRRLAADEIQQLKPQR